MANKVSRYGGERAPYILAKAKQLRRKNFKGILDHVRHLNDLYCKPPLKYASLNTLVHMAIYHVRNTSLKKEKTNECN